MTGYPTLPTQGNSINYADETIIPLSRVKLLLMAAGAGAFVALGLWLMQLDAATIASQPRFNSPPLVHGAGMAAVAFFGLCGLLAVVKLFNRKPGLILTEAGLFENASSAAAGLIPWSEIVGFEIFQVNRQKLLIVRVADPEKYVERGGAVKRALNRVNCRMCGSPVAISSNALKIGFQELLDLCESYRARYGGSDFIPEENSLNRPIPS